MLRAKEALMNDSDYIKPSERTLEQWEDDYFEFDELRASHAVADDIARELAEALCWALDVLYGASPDRDLSKEAGDAVRRYDKVMGGEQDNA